MQTYRVELSSKVSDSFLAQKAANSCDLNIKKKATHVLELKADVATEFNVGLILGNSGSGKSSLAQKIWGDDCFQHEFDPDVALINQFPNDWSYERIATLLGSVGLSQVPCWLRPAHTLSNGQRARATVALAIAKSKDPIIIDEWTSVVDRTVAKIMSHRVQKFVRAQKRSLVLLSCHYDVIEWLKPDWIIDCTTAKFEDRRLLQRERTEELNFKILPTNRDAWRFFSRYHYLSENFPPTTPFVFGLFTGAGQQIGIICFSEYVPKKRWIVHANRIVIHPDYCGIGLGTMLLNETARFVSQKGFRVLIKFSSLAMFHSLRRDLSWVIRDSDFRTAHAGNIAEGRDASIRQNVRWFSFEYLGNRRNSLTS